MNITTNIGGVVSCIQLPLTAAGVNTQQIGVLPPNAQILNIYADMAVADAATVSIGTATVPRLLSAATTLAAGRTAFPWLASWVNTGSNDTALYATFSAATTAGLGAITVQYVTPAG